MMKSCAQATRAAFMISSLVASGLVRAMLSLTDPSKKAVLGNNADLLADGTQLQLVDVVAVNQDATALGFVKPRQQFHNGALAAAAATDNSDERPGLHLKIDVLDTRAPSLKRKSTDWKVTSPATGGKEEARLLLRTLCFGVDHIAETLDRQCNTLETLPTGGQIEQRADDVSGNDLESNQLTNRELPVITR